MLLKQLRPTSKCSISKNTFQFDQTYIAEIKQIFKKNKIKEK